MSVAHMRGTIVSSPNTPGRALRVGPEEVDRATRGGDRRHPRRARFCARDDPHTAAAIGGSLWRWWQFGYLGEGRAALTAALERVGDVEDAAVAAALLGAGGLARSQGDLDAAERLLERSLEVHQRLDDPIGMARTLNNLGNVALSKHDPETARARYLATLEVANRTNDLTLRSIALNNLGELARRAGDLAAACGYYEESLLVDRERGDRFGIAQTQHGLGLTLHRLGDSDAAERALAECLALFGEFQELVGIAWALNAIATVRADRAPRTRPGFSERAIGSSRSSASRTRVTPMSARRSPTGWARRSSTALSPPAAR